MNKRQAQRLLNVARALRESPKPEAFNMNCYIHNDDTIDIVDGINTRWNNTTMNMEYVFNGVVIDTKEWCGTPACALGHYAARPDLQRLLFVGGSKRNPKLKLVASPKQDRQFSDIKVCQHFGITEDQANELFDHDGCGGAETAIEAAQYIERFVNQHYGTLT